MPQRALGHLSPVQALQDWQGRCPELFKKKVYNLTGLDVITRDGTHTRRIYAGTDGRTPVSLRCYTLVTQGAQPLVFGWKTRTRLGVGHTRPGHPV